ncbi:MAG: NADH dehydrogenase FAD-containing subunit [Candidatus Aegiribacteria sp.]|nr:NADH dehydrogenase FAD-containing subunit [Candidatus Aegiribacteria sp.]
MENLHEQIQELKDRIELLERNNPKDKLSIIVFSGSLDKLIAAFIIATGAAAMGTEVTLFFTFWGTAALRKKIKLKKDFISGMFGFLLPTGFDDLKLSKLNMAGAGTSIMKSLMKKKNIITLAEMLELSQEMNIKIYICEMSMDLMGMKHEEMVDYKNLEYCGVAKFLSEAYESRNSFFI